MKPKNYLMGETIKRAMRKAGEELKKATDRVRNGKDTLFEMYIKSEVDKGHICNNPLNSPIWVDAKWKGQEFESFSIEVELPESEI